MYKLLNFAVHGDHSGNLVALEKGVDYVFDVLRIYYIWGTEKNAIRGKHAHNKLKQLIVCLSGSCDFTLDNGSDRQVFHLESPTQGLYVEDFVWREFTNFSGDCIVMVLASEHYDETDYIRNYDKFLELIK
ncbi:FdtA/QdtA family cupin domain-containing protein [uncultured Desulfovibrio sp.]|uniref:sugar 3,4-ketoisomerase n=1 Tax=uncultured Desulfovibrio sp. TaxID=167968 RepID=UPI002630806A|nr:FdtA/QdtA family cupin domain-containing protein [uncultured Desulfovibrio sp.]